LPFWVMIAEIRLGCLAAMRRPTGAPACHACDHCEAVHDIGDIVERVAEGIARLHGRLAKAWQIRRYDVVVIRELRDQVAEHMTRRGKAVQQQNSGPAAVARFAAEDLGTADIHGPEMRCHRKSPFVGFTTSGPSRPLTAN